MTENDANLMQPGTAFVPTGSKVEQLKHGGEGSGNFGHAGRPGEVGGSGAGGGSAPSTGSLSGEKSAGSGSRSSGERKETTSELLDRLRREEKEEQDQRAAAEARHEAGVKAGKFPEPTKEDVESNRQSAKDIVGEVHDEYGRAAAQRQYEGIVKDIERGKKGDGTSDYSWMPGRMIALREEYERVLKIKK